MSKNKKIILICTITLLFSALLCSTIASHYYGSLHNAYAAFSSRLFGVMPVYALGEGKGVPVLMYHHLAPEDTYSGTSNEKNAAIISDSFFAEQMAYLAQNGYNTIFLSELITLLQTKEVLPEKTVVITFDDAYESVFIYAYPVLRQYGFKSNIAIIGNYINQPSQTAYNPAQLSTLSFAQIKEMKKSGLVEFQSHSFNLHQIVPVNSSGILGYASVDRIYLFEHLRRETKEEKQERLRNDFNLEEKLLNSLDIFSTVMIYPYGETDRNLIAMAKEFGMQAGFTVRTGFVTAFGDIYRLPRITVGQLDTMESFVRKLTIGK